MFTNALNYLLIYSIDMKIITNSIKRKRDNLLEFNLYKKIEFIKLNIIYF